MSVTKAMTTIQTAAQILIQQKNLLEGRGGARAVQVHGKQLLKGDLKKRICQCCSTHLCFVAVLNLDDNLSVVAFYFDDNFI